MKNNLLKAGGVFLKKESPPFTWHFWLVAMFLLTINVMLAQPLITNYTFSTTTTGSLDDLTTGSTATSIVGRNDDLATTTRYPIGWTFYFMGTPYTHFSVNSNGQLRLNTSITDPIISGSAIGPTAGQAILAPFGGDNETGNGVIYKLTGTPGSQKLVVEWTQFQTHWNNLSNAGNMQLWLDEATGAITYVYGEIYNASTSSITRPIGISSSNTVTTSGFVTIAAAPTFTPSATWTNQTIAAGANPVGSPLIANIGSAAQGSRRTFTWTPTCAVAPANPISLSYPTNGSASTTVQWVDNSTTEVAFVLQRSLDGITYTNVASVPSTTAAGTGTAYSSLQTGLTLSTLYYWRVISVCESKASSGLDGTNSTTGAQSISSTAQGGLWNSPATWTGGIVPSNFDNPTITAGSSVAIDVAVVANNLTVGGTLQWGSATNALTVTGNLLINAGGNLQAFNSGGTGQTINLFGNFTNNGNANLLVSALVFTGTTAQTFGGSGTFVSNVAGRALLATLTMQGTGSLAINVPVNIRTFNPLLGSITGGANIELDNNQSQVFNVPSFNGSINNVIVTNMGVGYPAAPVVFGAAVTPWSNITGVLNTLYFSGSNVYRCTAAANIGPAAPVHTSGTAQNLLWIGTLGTIGNPYLAGGTHVAGTQYFYGNNLYTCVLGGAGSITTGPTSTAFGAGAAIGTARFAYVGTAATVSLNYDATNLVVRSATITAAGSGYSNGSPSVVISPSTTLPTTAALINTLGLPAVVGPANTLVQKNAGVSITGAMSINCNQGISVPTAATGGFYAVAPGVAVAGPTGIPLNITFTATTYTGVPSAIAITGGTLILGASPYVLADFAYVVANGRLLSVTLTSTAAKYSTPPTSFSLTIPGGVNATFAFPASSFARVTAVLNSAGQLTNFTVLDPGFGYTAAPTLALATANAAAFEVAATTPTARVGLYNLALNNFTASTVNGITNSTVSTFAQHNENTNLAGFIPANRRVNVLTAAGGLGVLLAGNLNLPQTAGTSLVLTAGIVDLGGNTLTYNHPLAFGQSATAAGFVSNGTIELNSINTVTLTRTFPFRSGGSTGAVQLNIGAGSNATGSDITRLSCTQLGAPSGASANGGGTMIGTRSYRIDILTGTVFGTPASSPTVLLAWEGSDNLATDNPSLFLSQSNTNISSGWTNRSVAGGAGTLPATGTRTSATATVGPIVFASSMYFGWSSTFATPAPLNFVVTRSTNVNYNSIAELTAGGDGTGTVFNTPGDEGSVLIPFTGFTYQGSAVTGVRAHSNGLIYINNGLFTSAGGSNWDNTFAAAGNGFNGTSQFDKRNIVTPFYEDMNTNPTASALFGGTVPRGTSIFYKVVGNVCTVEWFNSTIFGLSGPQLFYQVVLDGSDNSITFNYGDMQAFNGTQNVRWSYSCGMSGAFVQAVPQPGQVFQQQYENSTYFTNENSAVASWGANGLAIAPEPHTRIRFVPGTYVAVAAPGTTPPVNDEAVSAITLTPQPTFPSNIAWNYNTNSSNIFTTLNATTSGQTICAGPTAAKDVWFKFNATNPDITVRLYASGGFIPRVEVLDAALNPLPAPACVVGTQGLTVTAALSGLTVTADYYVRVYHDNTGTTALATALISSGAVSGLIITPGTNYSDPAPAFGGFNPQNRNAVFRFSGGGGSGAAAAVTTALTGGVLTAGNVGISGGSGYTSAPTVTVNSPDFGLTGEFGIVVFAAAKNDEPSTAILLTNTNNGACVTATSVTDVDPSPAITDWQANNNQLVGEFSSAASQSSVGYTNPGSFGNIDDDIWYRFTVPSGNDVAEITMSATASTFDPAFMVYNLTPAGAPLFGVANTGVGGTEFARFSVVPGNTYLIRAYFQGTSTVFDGFDICVTTFSGPVNNNCIGATSLFVPTGAAGSVANAPIADAGLSFVTGAATLSPSVSLAAIANEFVTVVGVGIPANTIGLVNGAGTSIALQNAVLTTANSAGSYTYFINEFPSVSTNTATSSGNPVVSCGVADDDVWYTFTGNGSLQGVSVTGLGTFDPAFTIYSGTCGALVSLNCANASGAGGTENYSFTSTPATQYFVRVYSAGNTIADPLGFTISITNPTPACVASPSAPSNGSTVCVSSLPDFSWPAVAFATSYDVFYNFGGILTDAIPDNVVGTSFTPTGVTTDGTWSWRVVPKNSNGDATGCATFTFNVEAPVPTSTTADSRCGFGSLTLGATGSNLQWWANATGGTPLGVGGSFNTGDIAATTTFYASAGSVATGTATVGTGTATTLTTAISPYSNNWESSRIQYLITAAELSSAGFFAGNLTSLSLNVLSGESVFPLVNYTIRIGSTSATSLPGFDGTAIFTTVLNPVTYTVVLGTNTHVFNTPFNWNGSSNIVVEVCFDNDPLGTLGTVYDSNAEVNTTTTAFTSTAGRYADNNTLCGTTNGTLVTSSTRPNFTFGGQTICPGLRVPVVATVTAPVDPLGLEVAGTPVSSQTICAGTPSNNVELTNAIGSYDTYTWVPNTGFTGDGSGGNPFVFNPAGTTNYTLNASDAGSGCTDQINFTVNVNPLPNFTATVTPATVCELGATNLSAVNNVGGLVSNYTFAQSVGTYTPMVGGTTILTGAWDDTPTTNTVPIGFTFNFRGIDFTSLNVNPNGYITFGASSAFGYTPISSGTALAGGVIAAWGRDLQGQSTSEIKYLSSAGVFTIQWSDTRRYGGDPSEVINFQIQLVQATGQIRLVYGSWSNALAGPFSTNNGQVGLRGANNLDFNNRSVLTGGNWSASTAGTSVAATAFYNESSTATKPVSGLTYSFTPPAGFTYAWSTTPASAFTSTVEDPGSVVPVLGTTDFNLVVTNAITSCPNTFTSPVTVNPIAILNGITQTSTVCSGSPFSVALVGTNPVGTTYTWTAPVYAPNGVGMSGGAAATNQATLTQVVNNTSGVIKTATYTVTPSTGGCPGPAFTLVVTVYPVLLPPSITSFSFSSPTAVNLQWNPVTTATSYVVSSSNAPDITSGTYVETSLGVFLNNFSVVSAPLPAINLVSSSLYYYRIQSVNAVCGTSPVSDVTPFITDVKVWDGDLNSQNWNVSGNWSPPGVPVATDNVLIPSPSEVQSPIIQTSDPDGLANNLILASSAVVTIQANRALQVRGNIASSSPGATFNGPGRVLLNGTFLQNLTGANSINNLTLNNVAGANCPSGVISINGIATINSGTLNSNGNLRLVSNASTTGIISGANGTGNVTGNVQVNRFMPGGLGYRYVSSPVTGLNTSDFDVPLVGVNGLVWNPLVSIPSPFPNCWIYDETIDNVYPQYGWTSATGVSPIQLGRGYALIAPASHTASLVGPVNNGTLTNAINITKTGAFNGAGFNLLGNPYPSPISWAHFRETTNSSVDIAAVVKRFSATGQYFGQYLDWNGSQGTGGATDNIALGQAFFITKINTGTSAVTFTNADRRDITSTTFYEEQEQQVSSLLRMQLIGGAGADEFVLYFDQNATNNYDVNYDAIKFLSETAGIPNIYTNIDSLKVSINVLNALNHDMVIPMGIVAKTAGNYQVNVLEQANFAPTSMLFLEDRTLGIWSDLRTTNQYSVNLPVGEHNGRFFLHFRPAVDVQVANETCQQADGSVVVSNTSTEQQWTASLLNTAGQVVAQSSGANITFNNLSDGNYTLKLVDANGYSVEQPISIEAGINVEAAIAPLASSHYYTTDVIEASVQQVVAGASYEWYLNGVLKGTGTQISMNVTEAGVYTLTLKMLGSSCVFEANTSFSVTQESTVGIETAIDASGFIVYPNPVRDVLNVKINDNIGFTTLSIHDASGRLIHTEVLNGARGEQVIQVQMNDYAAGLYQITLEGNQKRSVAKFSKTK